MTKQEAIVVMLTERGCVEVPATSRFAKYRKFSRPNRDTFYFVGRKGALRKGRNISSSVSLTAYLNLTKIGQLTVAAAS